MMHAKNRAIVNVIRRTSARHKPWTVEIDSITVNIDTILVRYRYKMFEKTRYWFCSYSVTGHKVNVIQTMELSEDGEFIRPYDSVITPHS